MLAPRVVIGIALVASGCSKSSADPVTGAPPAAEVVPDVDVGLFAVDHPEQFPLVTAAERKTAPELLATGVVMADVQRNAPVVSLASGRVVAIHARVGDTVKRGQVLLSIKSDDVTGSLADYRKAVADEQLAHTQLERAKDLYDHGAIARADLELAETAENKARVDVDSKAEHLRLLGKNPAGTGDVIDIAAPVAGVITDQQVTSSAVLQASATAFTISDLSHVWILCDVYERDLAKVALGDGAEIRLNAYPDKQLHGTIGNIGAVLDPSLRTAKVRIEVDNPGILRLGMFATATFRGQSEETHVVVPASAVLHLHDRDWVYVPEKDHKFRRVEVVAGHPVDGKLQEIASGIRPGQQLVGDALVLDHAID
jgi:cobalt-zinc-cadmium efflux system membrane fusion protein